MSHLYPDDQKNSLIHLSLLFAGLLISNTKESDLSIVELRYPLDLCLLIAFCSPFHRCILYFSRNLGFRYTRFYVTFRESVIVVEKKYPI